jgi:hypothetical protein
VTRKLRKTGDKGDMRRDNGGSKYRSKTERRETREIRENGETDR